MRCVHCERARRRVLAGLALAAAATGAFALSALTVPREGQRGPAPSTAVRRSPSPRLGPRVQGEDLALRPALRPVTGTLNGERDAASADTLGDFIDLQLAVARKEARHGA